jgi:NADPH-dependent 2,4-dienoyl-CoA reductase/sulfur reductase-like enzyme
VNRRRRQTSYDRIVIVGAGRAGLAAAEELRAQGFPGEITILCDEPDAPYDRPACSKGILTGKQRPRDVLLPMRDGTRVRWQLGRRAAGIDTRAQVVYTESNEAYEYDGLVIATGGHPVTPANWPHGEPGIHVLHGLAGAWALRQDLRNADRVVVIGGGLTGCETACAVRSLARDCVLIDSNPQVMTRALGEDVGGFINDEIRGAGVELRLGRRVQEVARCRRRWRVRLDDGSDVDADIVVATIGERPNTTWLESAPELDISDGVRCDESLRVAGAENIVAAGSVARWPNLRYGGPPARCGQWIAAWEHGKTAARTLLAGDGPAAPMVMLPRFWSDQFGLRIQVSGALLPDAEVFLTEMRPGRRDVARAGVMASYVREGRLVGVVAVNAPRAFTSVTRALLAGATLAEPTPVTLAPATTTATTPRRRLSAVA